MKRSLKMKPVDQAAETVTFGIELETQIPNGATEVGSYHGRTFVFSGICAANSLAMTAPAFEGMNWRADCDGSIRCDLGFEPCEFVSPVLRGSAGVNHLIDFVAFAQSLGAKVNASCGCHVTVGIKSTLGTTDLVEVARFVKRVTSLANQNAWALYAQTGSGRHVNNTYAHTLRAEVADLLNQIEVAAERGDVSACRQLAARCGRGMVNIQKAFNGENGAIEFRVFAGTLNINKILHHVASAVGLMRRAAAAKVDPNFTHKAAKDAKHAVRRMWRLLGWVSYRRAPVAYGMCEALHSRFNNFAATALAMATKFETTYPAANL